MKAVSNVFFEEYNLKNQEIFKSFLVAHAKVNSPAYQSIMCSVSGGADSDCMLDIMTKIDANKKIKYVWIDTGLEYEATKKHLLYLEEKYNIAIEVIKAEKPIPLAIKEHGQPFLSKQVSENISRLQRHGFQWEDEPIEVLLERYCIWDDKKEDYLGCKIALQWWCNDRGESSHFNINRNPYLKEFLMAFPPLIPISNKCCYFAKKKPKEKYIEQEEVDLSITGLRKSEGGVRATAYKTCFSSKAFEADEYRPLWFYKNKDKEDYEAYFDVKHSCCYTQYGLKRTGCAGCPFGSDFENELAILKNYEPKLYKAALSIFGDAYNYTRMFEQFKKAIKEGKPYQIIPRPFDPSKLKKKIVQISIAQFLDQSN